jgi:hypothetical protein
VKVSLVRSDGYTADIVSQNLVIIGAWLTDMLPRIMNTSNVPAMMHQCRIALIPDSVQELAFLRKQALDVPFTSEGAMSVSLSFRKLAEALLKDEIENGQTA